MPPFDRTLPPPPPPEAYRRNTGSSRLPQAIPPPIPEAALRARKHTPLAVEAGPRPFSLRAAEATHASNEHPERNEDAAFYSTTRGISCVADGMGGVPAGELASGVAASILERQTLADLEKNATTSENRSAMRLVRRVFESDVATPLTKDAVEAATHELLGTMNDQIEQKVQKSGKALDRAAKYLYERGKIPNPIDPATRNVDRNRLTPDAKRLTEVAASMIGTTASLSKVWRDKEGKPFVTLGNIGDSRTYILRKGELIQLTEDHSPLTTLKRLGVKDIEGHPLSDEDGTEQRIQKSTLIELADSHPELRLAATKVMSSPGDTVELRTIRNIITGALGNASINKRVNGIAFEPHISTHALQEGDLLLSCTDGLIDNRKRSRMQEIANLYRHQGPEAVAKALADDAYHASLQPDGKKDDIRVVATEIRFAN